MSEAPRDTAGVIAPPPLLALAVVVCGFALDRFLPAYALSLLLSTSTRIAIGMLLILVCALLAVPAVLAFRQAGTHVEPWKPSSVLVRRGVFAYMRNPMYVGLTTLLAGLSIMFAGDWMLVLTIFFALTIHFGVVLREERYLTAKFGEPYLRYMEAVPRYGWPF
jgi:protein-S-isoprenylcysteine O-methyltransferase Ste14